MKHDELTNLFFKAKMIAPACSAAFPTIGSKIMLRKLTDKSQVVDASYETMSSNIITGRIQSNQIQ